MKIAVTAASGNLGSEIVRAAVSLVGKENVIALARTPSRAEHLGVEVRAGDYSSGTDLELSFRSVDTVLLVSGMDAPEKRIEQHRNVIRAAKNAGVNKIVYTSVQGADEGNAFSAVIRSNRQTEEDIRSSGMEWVIGRNGIYIEADIEYVETYKTKGFISNCAGDGKCTYTTRSELAYAYARMLTERRHNGKIYNLHGEAITQYQLAEYLNTVFGTNLVYNPMSVAEYTVDRAAELGDFIGNIIAGIYHGIREGKYNNCSHFAEAAGREHQSWVAYFENMKASISLTGVENILVNFPVAATYRRS